MNSLPNTLPVSWTFVSPCPTPNSVLSLLIPGEVAVASFSTLRDSATFTDRRLIVADVQGMSGRKIEVYSLPYSSIVMWSSENAGLVDVNGEIELWTKIGRLKVKIGRNIDIRQLDALIARCVLGM